MRPRHALPIAAGALLLAAVAAPAAAQQATLEVLAEELKRRAHRGQQP